MRRISRIKRPIGLLRTQSNARITSQYLCLACKHQTTSFSTSSPQAAPKVPYTEKIRQRIWGTDKPPGLKNPYGEASVFDQSKKGAPEQQLDAQNEQTEEPRKAVEQSRTEKPFAYEDEYKPAASWKGLKWIGGPPVWIPEEDFQGFLPADAASDQEKITAALHRAVVEAFAFQQAGKSPHQISGLEMNPNNDWTDDVQITPSATGAALQMLESMSFKQVADSLEAQVMEEEDYEVEPTESQEDVIADRSEVDPLNDGVVPGTDPTSETSEPTESEEDINADQSDEDPLFVTRTYEEVIASWDPSWLQIALEHPEIKFAVVKRVMQLTGIRLPDAAIESANTVKTLLHHLIARPKPRKLFEALEQKGDLLELRNVTVQRKKKSFRQKEKEIGRLKVIRKELAKRGIIIR